MNVGVIFLDLDALRAINWTRRLAPFAFPLSHEQERPDLPENGALQGPHPERVCSGKGFYVPHPDQDALNHYYHFYREQLLVLTTTEFNHRHGLGSLEYHWSRSPYYRPILFHGLTHFATKKAPKIRAKANKTAAECAITQIYEELDRFDPVAAATLPSAPRLLAPRGGVWCPPPLATS
jgi:hypothetical protein